MSLKPSSFGDESASGFRHEDQFDGPVREDGGENVDSGFVVLDERGGSPGRDTSPSSTDVGQSHGDAEFGLDTVEDTTEELPKLDKSVDSDVLSPRVTRETNESETMRLSFLDDSEGHFGIDPKLGREGLVGTFSRTDKTTERLDASENSGHITTLTFRNATSCLDHTMDLRSAINSIVLNTNFNTPLKLVGWKIAVPKRNTSGIDASIDKGFGFTLRGTVETTSKLVVHVGDGITGAGLDGGKVDDVDVGGGWHGGYEVADGVFDGCDVDDEEGLLAVLEGVSVVVLEGVLDAGGHLGWVDDGCGGSHDGQTVGMKG
ncbi:uncharacterized protein FMAN_12006 [Fusarium mangiferae]|uniref:Uncharacterized protein n=1 Tax=Fusarium mangiferae TaxID=192010 RepID=A0A1L7UF00_FUSMA|nr:uncharacterized protein FMAN_12006 [Fusarium mangiferae]CVL06913.1 uncharacterized protein FMAN_12006 [Fusarium mangiferae]